jgi:undecaprenyl-diphosphatase
VTEQGWTLRLRRSTAGQVLVRASHRTGVPGAVVLVLLSAGLVVALAGFGFAVALEDVMEGDGVVGADPWVQHFLVRHRTSALNEVFRAITRLGSAGVILVLALGVILFLLWRHERMLALGVVLATGGTAILVALVKMLVDRSRPPPIDRLSGATGASFPSGHSAEAIAFYGAIAWIVVVLVRGRRLRMLACAGALGLGLLVGFSRAYLGVHWASDVVSGWLLGLSWLAATIGVCALVPTMLETSRDARDQPEPRVD